MPEETHEEALRPLTNDERAELIAEHDRLMDAISGWQFRMGPVRLRGYFNSMRFARYFVGFHIVVGLAGAALIFFGGSPRDLGMAMVVGALFGFGAFLAQVWTMQVEKEHWLEEDDIRRRYSEVVNRMRTLDTNAEE
ncbi:hypothetical protein [Kribbella speibonae]|uniref:DUF4231 domain-containing protein n=1 Tax=Kribbella speibonae TaxID=1572660 RepID=A0A4R0J5Y8_9ACTN|nr:hypothetical protein [Kribbella speibonae]TCC40990.1 hypothetical protein E0H92_04765 [Kribbella speibonae]